MTHAIIDSDRLFFFGLKQWVVGLHKEFVCACASNSCPYKHAYTQNTFQKKKGGAHVDDGFSLKFQLYTPFKFEM